MDHLERFLALMEYEPVDRVPNWEAGAWPQTRARWEEEGLDPATVHWNWFPGEASLGMDPREFPGHLRIIPQTKHRRIPPSPEGSTSDCFPQLANNLP